MKSKKNGILWALFGLTAAFMMLIVVAAVLVPGKVAGIYALAVASLGISACTVAIVFVSRWDDNTEPNTTSLAG